MEMKSVSASVNNDWACSEIFYERANKNYEPVLKNASDRIDERAEYFGCSERTLQSYVSSGNVLGIEKRDGRCLYHCGPDEIKGPVPADDKKIMLRPGTRGISYTICNGSPVSSEIVISSVDLTTKEGMPRKHPTAVLRSLTSGPIVCVTCYC